MLKKMIGAIKAGQAYLGWDDALYRQTLARLTGFNGPDHLFQHVCYPQNAR